MKRREKYNTFYAGLLPGVLLPVVTFLVYWKVVSGLTLSEYIEQFYRINKLSSLISLSAIPNLLLFFIFIWSTMYRAAKGVIYATIVVAVIMIIVKFF
ncbi:MAG: hypothetical protein K9J30_05885 [Bacteroidales bacterium]|nr:hypothetical protein [Bacteroidales bacterium]